MKLLIWAIIKTDVVKRKLVMDNARDEKDKLFKRLYYTLTHEYELTRMERIQVLRKLYETVKKETEMEVKSVALKYSELESVNDEMKHMI